jgi:hypothetical protein
VVRPGTGPSSSGKAIGFAVLSVAVLFGAGFWFESMIRNLSYLIALPLLLMLGSAFIPGLAWRRLGMTLLAYAFAARIPVLVVMFLAMRGNGGAGWGTHYDAIAPMFVHLSFAKKYVIEALIPQMTLWIGWTVAIGALFGTVAAAVARRQLPELRNSSSSFSSVEGARLCQRPKACYWEGWDSSAWNCCRSCGSTG